MPALVINGITVPVGAESLTRSVEEVGERTRAFDGTAILNRRWQKRVLELEIPVASQADQLAWMSLLRGEGHVWSFNSNVYSAKGLPLSGATAVIGSTAPMPKYGAGRLATGASTVGAATKLGPAWTVAAWNWSGSVWNHYVVNSLGQKWFNGSRNDAASSAWLSVSASGDLTFSAGIYLDDLVALPAVMPTTWPPLLHATGRAFPSLPRLEGYGDVFPGSSASAPVSLRGEVSSMSYAPAWINGTWTPMAGSLSVTLREE